MRVSDNNLDMMQKITNQMYAMITNQESGSQPSTTMVQLCHPGIPINEDDYSDALSPSNPQGDNSTALAFSSLIDNIPKCGLINYVPSGATVDKAFELCIQANAKSKDDNPEKMAKLEEARGKLWEVQEMQDGHGKTVKHYVPTMDYQDYLDKQLIYQNAVQAVLALKYECDLKTEEGKKKYQKEAPDLINKKNTAKKDWDSTRPKIDKYLNTIATTINDVTSYGIRKARETYDTCLISDPSTGEMRHVSFAFPSNWYDASLEKNMSNIEVSYSIQDQTKSDYYEKYGGKTSFDAGLWTFNASGGHTTEGQTGTSSSTNMKISFKLGNIQIQRPWMETSFFKLNNWYLQDQPKGAISAGKAPNNDDLLLPQFPVQFFVARDIKISAEWSDSDLEIIKQATEGNASIGWGCFQLNGNYEFSKNQEKFHSEFDGTTITVPGIQIIGFVSSIPTPLCPPMDGYSKDSLTSDIGYNRAVLKNKTKN